MAKKEEYHLIEDFPNRLYFSIAEVAKDLHVEQSTLRFWEKEFNAFYNPHRDPRGRRQYTAKDIKIIRQIHHLVKVEGMQLDGAKHRLKHDKDGVEKNQEIYNRLITLRTKLMSLKQLLTLPEEAEEESDKDKEQREAREKLGRTLVGKYVEVKEEEEEKDNSTDKSESEVTEIKAEKAEETGKQATETISDVHIFRQESLLGEEYAETIEYIPPKAEQTTTSEEENNNDREEEDPRQLSLF